MAKIIDGINGIFSGKVGPVVGVNLKDNPHMRAAPKKSTVPPSLAQLTYRARFGTVSRFLAPLAVIQDYWYGQPEGMKSRRNLAQSYHVGHATSGTYPNFKINYQKVLITRGEAAGVDGLQYERTAEGTVNFTWHDNSSKALADPDDLFLVVFYHPGTNVFAFESTGIRTTGQFSFELPMEWSGENLHAWVSFLSTVDGTASNSSYVGMIEANNSGGYESGNGLSGPGSDSVVSRRNSIPVGSEVFLVFHAGLEQPQNNSVPDLRLSRDGPREGIQAIIDGDGRA